MTDNIIFYEGDDNGLRIKTLVEDDNLWLTQAQLADLYHTSKQNIGQHLKKCFAEQELDKNSVVKNFFTTATDGKKYNTMFYNLDVIIWLGYRIDSDTAIKFRQWATERLHEYIQKSFPYIERYLGCLFWKQCNLRINSHPCLLRQYSV